MADTHQRDTAFTVPWQSILLPHSYHRVQLKSVVARSHLWAFMALRLTYGVFLDNNALLKQLNDPCVREDVGSMSAGHTPYTRVRHSPLEVETIC